MFRLYGFIRLNESANVFLAEVVTKTRQTARPYLSPVRRRLPARLDLNLHRWPLVLPYAGRMLSEFSAMLSDITPSWNSWYQRSV